MVYIDRLKDLRAKRQKIRSELQILGERIIKTQTDFINREHGIRVEFEHEVQRAIAEIAKVKYSNAERRKVEFEKAKNDAEKKAGVMEQLFQKRISEMEGVNSELKEKRNELSDINRIVTDLHLRKETLSDEIGNKESRISGIEELLGKLEKSKLEMIDKIDEITKDLSRSEERRVGKECRSRWSPYH